MRANTKKFTSGNASVKLAFVLFGTLAAVALSSFALDWLLRVENFPVRQVRFEGPFQHVMRAQLESAVLERVSGNFFLVDIESIKQEVETIPWVYRASVRRNFNQELYVQFTEQQLVARWNEHEWVNRYGEVVQGVDDVTDKLPHFRGPSGTSTQVLGRYQEFRTRLASLGFVIAGVTLTPRQSWRLEIESATADEPMRHMVLVLDHDHPVSKIERFARVYRATFAAETAVIKQVDLRYTNGFAVEWRNSRGDTQDKLAGNNSNVQNTKGTHG